MSRRNDVLDRNAQAVLDAQENFDGPRGPENDGIYRSATETGYPGAPAQPYPPTDFGTNVLVTTGGVGPTNPNDFLQDPILAQLGLTGGNPMPPENNVHDLIETDALTDTKDYSRRLRAPNDAIVAAYRNKYPTQIAGGYPAIEPPVPQT
jgi:hypothetical protein